MKLVEKFSPGALFAAITGRRETQSREIEEQQEIIRLLLKDFGSYPSDWIWHTDSENRLVRVSDRFASATNQPKEAMSGRALGDFLRSLSEENAAIALEIEREVETRSMFHDVIVKVDRDGDEHWWRLTGKPTFDAKGAFTGYLGSAADITTERLAERKVNFLAHHDSLTGLLNRGKLPNTCGWPSRALSVTARLLRCSIWTSISSNRSTTVAVTW